MKKTWNAPKLTAYGAVNNLTQQVKTFGRQDGIFLAIPGLQSPVPIGS
ncbi:MAG: lasso peptide [Calothrix sp. MO_167.B12]|nr:lasso peptide [Calothrix sp. MO_167.B12]